MVINFIIYIYQAYIKTTFNKNRRFKVFKGKNIKTFWKLIEKLIIIYKYFVYFKPKNKLLKFWST